MSGGTHKFPSELVSPKDKAKEEYGLKWAKAIYYNNEVNGSSMFYNDRDIYRTYMNYALGKQDENQYKPLLGVNPRENKDSMLPSIRWGIRNYATKKINVVVSNVSNRGFDPTAKAVDQLANDIKNDFKTRLKIYVENKTFLDSLQQKGVNTIPEGLSIDEVPTNHEDIEILMRSSFKFRSEMELEKGLTYHLERNNFEQIRKQLIWDCFVLGVSSVYSDLDEYGKPYIRRIPPEDMILPYSELPDFSNINYGGHIERLTMSEFRKIANGQFSDQEFQHIEDNYTTATDRDKKKYYTESNNSYNDTKKIRVLFFEYETHDEMVHLEKKDKNGQVRFSRKDYSYYASEKEQSKFKKKYKGERKLHRTPYTSVYKGAWVVGSDYIFNYERKSNVPSKRNSFGGTALGYKVYAPNLFTGEVVSTVKQMIPVLDTLQQYNLKLQHIVASAVPKGLEIDLFQLSNVDFVGANGKSLSDLDKINMFKQMGIILRNSQGKTLPGSNNTPIRELENGMAQDVVKLIDLIRLELETLDEIVGVNRVMAAGNLHQDTGKAAAEMQYQSAQSAIDYIYDADTYLFKELCKSLSELHIQSAKILDNKKHYQNIMGENSIRFLMSDHGLEKHDFGIYLEPRPDEQAWQRFYMRVQEALKMGQITISHATRAERLDNLKEAEMYLEVAIADVQKKAQEAKERDMQMNAQIQQQSAQMAQQNAIALEEEKKRTIMLEAEEGRKTLLLEYKLKKELESLGQTIKGDYKLGEAERMSSSKENIAVLQSLNNKKENG